MVRWNVNPAPGEPLAPASALWLGLVQDAKVAANPLETGPFAVREVQYFKGKCRLHCFS
jgi:hypothetical protein